ncbi:MAG: acetate--CoA ligase family protein [Flavobacteriaceae bacterium]
MISQSLLNPENIVIVGGSDDITKPGGKVLQNILEHGFKGDLLCVNPKMPKIKGVSSFTSCEQLPNVSLAIIAIASKYVEETMRVLINQKKCKTFIVFSAGFSETGTEGKALEQTCVKMVQEVGGTLIGPNCIGVITENYKGVFAGPIPKYDLRGCDFASESGATLVFILEMAIPRGLKFRDIFSIGNSAQIGVEDILEYWDTTFDANKSSKIKLLYLEKISQPDRFLKHARSLIAKGCRIAAIKSGATDAGSRAVSSHTGSLSGSNIAVSALFRKAGVIRCFSRVELVYMACVFTYTALKGKNIAVITHAGGPGVMLTDALIKGGLNVPTIEGPDADALLAKLHPGSTVSNPIDFLATGTAEQLGNILDSVENSFDHIDASAVVFGTTGMWKVGDVYTVLHKKMKSCKKPIYPILPSIIQAAEEVNLFQEMGHVNFTDEVSFGYVLSRAYKIQKPYPVPTLPEVDTKTIRQIIENNKEGYLNPTAIEKLFLAANIPFVNQKTVHSIQEAINVGACFQSPLVMKVNGPIHKSDLKGVILDINNNEDIKIAYEKLIAIKGADSVLIQEQKSGIELFIGASREDAYGHVILCGLGGIYVEVFKDVTSALAPIGNQEALNMIRHLKSYPIIQGVRGKKGVNEELFANTIVNLSALLQCAPEIKELDINPLIGNAYSLIAVDARVLISKN